MPNIFLLGLVHNGTLVKIYMHDLSSSKNVLFLAAHHKSQDEWNFHYSCPLISYHWDSVNAQIRNLEALNHVVCVVWQNEELNEHAGLNEELNEHARQFVRENACVKGKKNLTAVSFCHWTNEQLLVNSVLEPGYPRRISLSTATRWLHKLGFEVVTKKKGTYVDGHERSDEVEYWRKF